MQWVNPKEKGGSLLKNIFDIDYFKNFSDKKNCWKPFTMFYRIVVLQKKLGQFQVKNLG